MFGLPSLLALVLLSPLAILAQSSNPTLVYPIDQQLPPVAHVGSAFNFSLIQGTFASTSSNPLTYSVTDLPKWAVFNNESLLFAGVPSGFDEGRSRVKVTASDGSDNRTSVFTLLVVSTPPPLLLTPISSQLTNTRSISSAVRLPSSRGVLVHPYYSFSLGFVLSTYLSTTGSQIFYSALTTSTIALPSWLTFDNATATFYGVAPGTGSWDIVLVGSEYYGFGDMRETFSLEIGEHALDLVQDLAEVQGVMGTELDAPISVRGLRLDGLNVTREEVTAQVVLDGYDWLSFRETNFTLTGTPPVGFINGTTAPILIPITFTSAATNVSISSTLPLDIVPFPFTALILPNASATSNTTFTASVSSYLVNRTATLSAAYNPEEVGDWLKFDAATGELKGQVPGKTSYDQAEVKITATDPSSGLAGTATLPFAVVGAVHVPSTATGSSASASASSTAGAGTGGSGGLSLGAKIAIGATLGGLFLLGLLILLLICCCRRRRRNRSRIAAAAAYQHEKKPPGLDNDGEMTNVELGGGPFEKTLAAGAAASAKSPKKDRPRRLDLMRGMFGSSRNNAAGEDGENVSTGNHSEHLAKDLSGLPRTIPRSSSDASFFSGMSHDVNRDLSPEHTGVNEPVPFGVRLVGAGHPRPSRETGTTRGELSRSGSSPTFSSVGGDDADSRASWESERSFRWRSDRDVAGSGAVMPSETMDSIPRPRHGFANQHTPTSAVFPPGSGVAQIEREDTANSSTFADASTPNQSRHQLAGAGAESSAESDGFGSSNQSTSFGGSVTSPLSRFGQPTSHPSGFASLGENGEHHHSSSDDNHSDLMHASTSNPYSLRSEDAHPSAIQTVRLLPTPANIHPSHAPGSSSAGSSSTRPRPRLIPSRERVPTISPPQPAYLSPRPSTSTHRESEDLVDDGREDDSFVDADEDDLGRQSVEYGSDLGGLGYPHQEAIYFEEPPASPFSAPLHRFEEGDPNPSIRQVGGPPAPPPHDRDAEGEMPVLGRPLSDESAGGIVDSYQRR